MDTLKLVYTQDEAFDLVEEYTEAYKNKIKELEEENKNLNIKVASLEGEIKGLNSVIDKLKEENQTLELWLDNKEKVNKSLREDLSECECSFGFESDEVGFWKREYKRLKKWIKDHCNGYGNLFPEDEMKRQWKKADKKRKLKSTYVYDAKQVRDIC